MKAGRVIGKVWATRKLEQLPPGALIELRLENEKGEPLGERVIAFDPLSCGRRERVLITTGSVARGWFDAPNVVDALVIGSLDEEAEKK